MALDPRFPRTALAAALSALGAAAWAAPTGGEVVQGTASISQAGTTTTIQQSTARAAINWQQFGIAANESVVFQQPSASAVTLNRVLGQDASSILGSLSANGQVFLLNPNGVLFGSGAQVNVGGLVASSLGLSDADFMAGNLRFVRDGAATPGAVLNQGSITVPGGVVALIGPDVRNTGTITATAGAIGLAAGDAVTLNLGGSPLLGITIDQGSLNALVQNGSNGRLSANGGEVRLSARAADALHRSAVNNSGFIEATFLQSSGRSGTVVLLAEGGSVTASTIRTSQIDAQASHDVFLQSLDAESLISAESTDQGDVKMSLKLSAGLNPTLAAASRNGSIDIQTEGSNVTIITLGDVGTLGGLKAKGNIDLTSTASADVERAIVAGGAVNLSVRGALNVDAPVVSGSDVTARAGAIRLRPGGDVESGGSATFKFGSLFAAIGTRLTAANGISVVAEKRSGVGADGGSVFLQRVTFDAGGPILVEAGSGNDADPNFGSARGGSGGDVDLEAVNFLSPRVDLRAGDGGDAIRGVRGRGGIIGVNGPVTFSGDASLRAGLFGIGESGDFGREISGSDMDLRARGSLSIENALRIRSTQGDITLRAGMSPGDSLSLLGTEVLLANASTGRINLEGYSIPIQPYQAHTLSIRTAGSIGSAASHYLTNVSALALESTEGAIHVTNGSGLTVAARTGGGDIEIRTANGANQPNAVGGAGGQLTVGSVAGLTGIQTAGQGNVRLLPGNGGNGPTSLFGGLGGYVIVDSPIQAGGQLTLAGGTGGAGGSGGLGGTIRLNAPIDAGDVVITAGRGGGAVNGGLSGAGGSISVDAPVHAARSLDIQAGAAGPIPDRSTALIGNPGIITGSRIELTADDDLRVGSRIDFVGGPVRLHAGADPGDTVTLDGQVRAEVGGDAVRISGSRFVNHAGADAISTPNGRWIVWSDSPVGNVFGGLQSGNTAVWGTAYDPAHPTVAEPGNRFVFREQQLLGTVLVKADDQTKVYGDSFTEFTYTSTATAGDAASGATYGNAFTDVGGSTNGGPVAVEGVVLSSAGAAPTATRTGGLGGGAGYAIDVDVGAATAPGYTRFIGQGGLLTVQPRPVTVSASGSKVYDGRTSFAEARFSVDGLVNGDLLGATGNAAFADKHVGTDKPLTLTGVTLAANPNYVLASVAGSGDITPRELRLIASSDTKVYDRTNGSQGSVQVAGLAEGDTVSGLTQRFDARDAGSRRLLVDAGYVVDDGRSGGNYTVTLQEAAGQITPKTLGAAVTADSRVYDGSRVATVATRSLSGVIDGDVVGATGGTASFDTRHVGTAKTVTVTGLGLAGADAANYRVDGSALTTADITPKTLTVGGAVASNKVYDGTAAATVAGAVLVGAIGGDDVRLANASTGVFADRNVGNGVAVTTAMALGGAQLGNYTLVQPGGLRANITPAALTVTARDDTKPITLVPYAGGNGITVSGLVPGETPDVLGGTLSYGGSSQGALLPGNYSIVPRGLTARNYGITYVPGRLTITNRFDPDTQQLLRWLRSILGGWLP